MDMRDPRSAHLKSGAINLGTPGSAANSITSLEEKSFLAYTELVTSIW